MALVSFQTRGTDSLKQIGVWHGRTIAPLVGYSDCHSMKALLHRLNGDVSECEADTKGVIATDEVDWLPPIVSPGKIFCIGLNYHAHRIETGNQEREYPTVFSRFHTCLTGHQQDVWRPEVSTKMDYEGELAVIIGRSGHRVREADAWNHVAGFSCFNDISIRDWQRHTSQFTPGKNFMRTGAFGPALVPRQHVPDPEGLTLITRLNGEVMQQTTTDLMIFSVPRLIAYITTFTRLEPGDVIVTGTPGGVGVKRDPQVFMRPGDVVEVDISGVGTLRNSVIDEPASA